jgi:hypothetical protein
MGKEADRQRTSDGEVVVANSIHSLRMLVLRRGSLWGNADLLWVSVIRLFPDLVHGKDQSDQLFTLLNSRYRLSLI